MNENELEDLLRLHREKPLPRPPGNLAQNVWREIRRRREAGEGWLAWLLEPICQPRVVACALALAVMTGAGWSLKAASADPPKARAALELQVFSPVSPSLPSTLLHASL